MSRTYFSSPGEPVVEIQNRDLSEFGNMLSKFVVDAFNLYATRGSFYQETSPLRTLVYDTFTDKLIAGTGAIYNNNLIQHLLSDNYYIKVGDLIIPSSDFMGNTALDIGNDQIIFLTRMTLQSRFLASYVEGRNRTWLADIIEFGLTNTCIMEENVGWEAVIALLRKSGDKPLVITNSSGGMWYPLAREAISEGLYSYPQYTNRFYEENREYGEDIVGAEDEEAWERMDEDDRWAIAMDGLRARNVHSLLELKPENWYRKDYGFGAGYGAFQIKKYAQQFKEEPPIWERNLRVVG